MCVENESWIIYEDGEISDLQKNKEVIGEVSAKLIKLDELKNLWLTYPDRKQIVLYVDGLGWHQLQHSLSKLPYFSSFNFTCGLSSWPPITNTALASMLCGQDASVHQIRSHADRKLNESTIFEELSGSCAYIEGERSILHIKHPVLLNPKDEMDSDRAVLACLKKQLDHDFIFVHIHGYDDVCHECSPDSTQAEAKLIWLDEQLGNLLSEVSGIIWLISDHGQHSEDEKGNHGIFCEDDMLIPVGLREN